MAPFTHFFSDDFDVYAERSCVRPVAGVHVEASCDDVHVKRSLINLTSFKALTAPRGV